MIWLRWATEAVEGLQKASAVKEETGEDQPNPLRWQSQSHRNEVPSIWEQCLRKVLTLHGFRQVLYIGILGTVICPITSPRFVEANESGVNFPQRLQLQQPLRKLTHLRDSWRQIRFWKLLKFSKCCMFVRLVQDDLVVHGYLMIVHGWLPWTNFIIHGRLGSTSTIIVYEHIFLFWGDSWSNLLYWLWTMTLDELELRLIFYFSIICNQKRRKKLGNSKQKIVEC